MSFRPDIGDRLTINGSEYEFARFQGAADFAMDVVHAQEGRKGIVYRMLSSRGQEYALKIFFPDFRTPRILKSSHQLAHYKNVAGLSVCDRTVITSEEDCAQLDRYPDLRYAVLMPWITGQTWFDVVVSQYQGHPITFTRSQCYDLALNTSGIMADLERRRLAHCDISNGNIIFDQPQRMIELIDVEDMYGPGFERPRRLPAGSKGYAHPSLRESDGEWSPAADRFSSAVLLAEFLCWYLPGVRELVNDDTYFTSDEEGRICPRYYALYENLAANYSPVVADLFKEAWLSTRLADCPSLNDWAEGLASVEGRAVPLLEVSPDTIDFGDVGQVPAIRDLSLSNSGQAAVQGTIRVTDGPWLSVAENSFSLAPGAGRRVKVQANPLQGQTAQTISVGNISIKSNGGDVDVLAEARHLPTVVPKKKGRKLRTLFGTALYLAILIFLLPMTIYGYGTMQLVGLGGALLVSALYVRWLVRARRRSKQLQYVPPPKPAKSAKKKKGKTTPQLADMDQIVIPKQPVARTRGTKLQADVLVIGLTKKWAEKSGSEIKRKGYRVAAGDKHVNVNSPKLEIPKMILFGPMDLTTENISRYRKIAAAASSSMLVLATRDADAAARIIKASLPADDYILGDEVQNLGDWVNKIMSRGFYQPQGGAARRIGSLVVDPTSRQATLGGRQIDLSAVEFDLLLTLVDRQDFVSYATIGRQVWGVSSGRKEATDIFVESLRRKLAAGDVRIANVENLGYLVVVAG